MNTTASLQALSNLSAMTSSAASSHSATGQLSPYKLRNITMAARPQVDILIQGSGDGSGSGLHGGYCTSFSTRDEIKGTVNITAAQDIRFDDIEISFIGVAKTFVDRLTSAPTISGGRTEATHRFLKLVQPLDESVLPHPRIFSAGQTHSIPFTFVVPERLLERSCQHKVANDTIREAHLHLPPSLGDAEVAGFAGHLIDDMSPEMAKIIYVIKVKAVQYGLAEETETTVIDKFRKVRIKPEFEEAPPLNVDGKEDEYRLREEKSIRKGVFKGKAGTLVMEAHQPKSLRIPGARTPGKPPVISTVARVMLRFDPADEASQPPRLASLTSKLKVCTLYASTPRVVLPSKATLAYDLTQGYYSLHVPLSSRCIAGAKWTRHESETTARRDSGASLPGSELAGLVGIPEASSGYDGKAFYTASVLVPVSLPNNKTYIPTFNSCLVGRHYKLLLSLSIASSLRSSLSLKVPIQVSAAGSEAGMAALEQQRQLDQAVDDVDELLQPRGVAPPPEDEYPRRSGSFGGGVLGSQDLPPSYQVLASRRPTGVSVVG